MKTVNQVFSEAKNQNRLALIAYLPAGYPNNELSHRLIDTLIENGVDLIEVGFPYSDPLMDGPIIQTAVQDALSKGTRAKDVFKAIDHAQQAGAAAVVMSYFNPIFKYGFNDFAKALASAGGAGVITPDLIPDEATEWIKQVNINKLDNIFLVAPSSTDERIRMVAENSTGFIYAASLMGVTGVKSAQIETVKNLVARIRKFTNKPIAVGLGVNTPDQVMEIAKFADGVIVGSAFIKAVSEASNDSDAVDVVARLASALAAATGKIG